MPVGGVIEDTSLGRRVVCKVSNNVVGYLVVTGTVLMDGLVLLRTDCCVFDCIVVLCGLVDSDFGAFVLTVGFGVVIIGCNTVGVLFGTALVTAEVFVLLFNSSSSDGSLSSKLAASSLSSSSFSSS